ncbi:short-chain dehydrogenase [Seiridium cupressi]
MVSLTDPYADLHQDPRGKDDVRPTALRIIEDEGLVGRMTDKVMLVTGGSSGLGIETVRALYATGATVFAQVRNIPKGQAVRQEILTSIKSEGSINLLEMRLDSLQSVRKGVAALLRQTSTLNVLGNNAGVRNTPDVLTEDGFETQLAVNHLAHFLIFQLLRDTLLASSTPAFASRVVNVTSGAQNRATIDFDNLNLRGGAYEPRLAYANPKIANIWMANHVERLYGDRGLHALSVHPGGILTGLQKEDDEATRRRLLADPELARALKSPAQGAATQVWAAVAKVWEGSGGKYLEDCRVSRPSEKPSILWGGHGPNTYNENSELELWKLSNKMVGLGAGE